MISFRLAKLIQLQKMQEGLCAYCGRRFGRTGRRARTTHAKNRQPTIDHVHPTSRGGTDDFDNLVCACRHCNQEKGNRFYITEWMPAEVGPDNRFIGT